MGKPVILDTDIGFDVDDVWALAFLLKCPELDIKLITTATGDTRYRARIVAKMLELAGRTDIPIGIGLSLDTTPETHKAWLGDYTLTGYPGEVIGDGIGAICDVISQSPEQVSVIGIGPLPNIAAALDRVPGITNNARFIGMHGSIYRGYLGAAKPMREYNVKVHALSCKVVLEADWEKIITPLDTCGTVKLEGDRFQRVASSQNPLTQAIIQNHYGWFEQVKDWPIMQNAKPQEESSILYDSVAIYLAITTDCLGMETLNVEVTPDGKTLVSDQGKPVSCATTWQDKEAFLDFLVERLT